MSRVGSGGGSVNTAPNKSYSANEVVSAVETEAAKFGVPFSTAWADVMTESGGNPYAVNPSGTSFGIFQLTKGGELGSLTPQQAYDPYTNAAVALNEFASVAKANPSITNNPAAWAAAAQRPANVTQYEARFNSFYNKSETPKQAAALENYTGVAGLRPNSTAGSVTGNVTSAVGGAASAAATNVTNGITGLFSSFGDGVIKGVAVALALIIAIVGLVIAFKSTSVGQVVGSATGTAAKVAAA